MEEISKAYFEGKELLKGCNLFVRTYIIRGYETQYKIGKNLNESSNEAFVMIEKTTKDRCIRGVSE